MSDTAYVSALPECDIHRLSLKQPDVLAAYDARVKIDGHTTWGYVCQECFDTYSATGGSLGTGKGQRLVVGEKPRATDGHKPGTVGYMLASNAAEKNRRAEVLAAIEAGDFDLAEELIGDEDPFSFL